MERRQPLGEAAAAEKFFFVMGFITTDDEPR